MRMGVFQVGQPLRPSTRDGQAPSSPKIVWLTPVRFEELRDETSVLHVPVQVFLSELRTSDDGQRQRTAL